ncbi:cytochrome C oxidase subunit IV [Thioclava sp. SK-1]|nr:aa3-type cytochrome c oxidase subunit IV [Thioclava sp. SK-1]OCX66889.1 cytochrome C oxidase subunit IV [Thioclava sp. SK-1]
MAEHKHGEMDIRDHEKTFAGFVKFVTYTVVVIIAFLVFLALVGA